MNDDIRNKIKTKIKSLLADNAIYFSDQDSLVTSGLLNSLKVVTLATWLEQEYKIDFSKHSFNVFDFESVESIEALVRRNR